MLAIPGRTGPSAITIRRADPYEHGVLLGLVHERLAEMAHPDPDLPGCSAAITELMGPKGIPLVAEQGGKVVGCLLLAMAKNPWERKPRLIEQGFFVSRSARASRAAVDLLRAAKRVAVAAGLGLSFAAHTFGTVQSRERFDRFMTRQGLERVGTVLHWDPPEPREP